MSVDLQRKRDLGKILDDAFGFYRSHWRTLLAVAVVVVVPVHLIVYGVGLGWLWEGYTDTPSGDDLTLGDLTDGLVGLAAQLLIVTPLVTAMTVHVVKTGAGGAAVAVKDALRAGLGSFVRLVGAVLLVVIGIAGVPGLLIAAGALADNEQLVAIGLLAFGLLAIMLGIRWAVVPQVVVVEGARGPGAIQRSTALTQRRGWFVFLVLLVTNVLVTVLSGIALLPLEAAAKSADAQALSLVGAMLGAVITLPILAVAQTLLYYALLVEREGVPAAPPAQRPPPPPPPSPRTLPGVPGTFGDGFAPPTPPDRG